MKVTNLRKTALGASSPAKPALLQYELKDKLGIDYNAESGGECASYPLSMTIATTSVNFLIISFSFDAVE